MKFAKMNQKIKKAWVKALRSGEYKQAAGMLRTSLLDGKYGYCCLGVLQHTLTGKQPKLGQGMLTDKFAAKCGIPRLRESGSCDALPTDVCTTLAEKNDSGWSFKRIANWIEKNL